MYKKQKLGKWGEDIAKKFLEKNNYIILKRNYRNKFGEIDIITKKGNCIVFVEVKTRTNFNYGLPSESITRNKRSHLVKTIQYYLNANRVYNKATQIDAIEVIYINKKIFINHIKQII